jgi:plastocyanin
VLLKLTNTIGRSEAAIEGGKTMLKVLGLVLAGGLLVSFTACGGATAPNANQSNKGPNQNQNNNTKSEKTSNDNVNTTPPTNTSPPAQTAPMTATVKNDDLAWKDDASGTPVTTIKVGGTITWTITSDTHSIKRVAPSAASGCDALESTFDSGNLNEGQSVSKTFTKAGTFGYRCGIHGGTPNCKTPPGSGLMPGVIKVVP